MAVGLVSRQVAKRVRICHSNPLNIIIDTREQDISAYRFERYHAIVERRKLDAGDYSIAGHESIIACERKSLDDLIGCLTSSRARFKRQLERLRELRHRAIIVEASLDDIRNSRYFGKTNPHSALQSIISMQIQYDVPFVFVGTAAGGEYWTYWMLEKYYRGI